MEELIGKVIGGCEIDALIGQGGMGVVYRARHIGLDITVAVKVLLPIDPQIGSAERFLREARTAARLKHPHIVGVLNVGYELGYHFIVMDYVDGCNLAALISEHKRIGAPEAVRIACQVLDALDLAYHRGIIHRDIKPENILIDKSGTAKIADLGLAKTANDPTLTCTSVALGSPYYIAPEQAENPREVDHRADIYSLGCTVYHMIAGKPPYDGQSAIEIILDHIRRPVPLLAETVKGTSVVLSDTVGKMMAKSPADRFQEPSQARAALMDAIGADLHATTVPVYGGQVRARTRKLKVGSIAAGLSIAAIIAWLIAGSSSRKVGVAGAKTDTVAPSDSVPGKPAAQSAPGAGAAKPARSSGAPMEKQQPAARRTPPQRRAPEAPAKRDVSLSDVVKQGQTDALAWLLDNGVPPNVGQGAPTTPLHLAIHNGSAAQVKLLLDRGANPNIADSDGDCPLHYALRGDDYQIVKLLLERGANPNVKDRYGATPLRIAQALKKRSFEQLLRERGAN